MSFFKRFKKKDPLQKLIDDFRLIEIKDKAINLLDLLTVHDKNLVDNYISEMIDTDELVGIMVGNQGWFLPGGKEKLDRVWNDFKKGSIDLEIIGKNWGLNAKRCYLALSERAKSQKIKEPYFARDGNILFLSTYLNQKWTDAISIINFEEEEEDLRFEAVLDKVNISKDHFTFLKKYISNVLKEESSDIALGKDGKLRRKEDLLEIISDSIADKWEQKFTEISYEDISREFGLTLNEVTEYIIKLTDNNLLPHTTNYPVDEILKPRNL